MELTAELSAPCAPDELFGWIDDLSRYPDWMGLVHSATPVDTADADGPPAWDVELRARLGPFARSKRLTMVRTMCDPGRAVKFERREFDGRQHGAWELEARVEPVGSASLMEMRLYYGGSLWTAGLMERALHDEINRSRDRLVRVIAENRL